MVCIHVYGMATISRLLKIIGLICKRALQKKLYCAKETCNVKEPTNRGHPICHDTFVRDDTHLICQRGAERECVCVGVCDVSLEHFEHVESDCFKT